ncbi:MAG: HlyD family secretion protein [Devosia sp.]|uniref:HlyD family secretion protein n=1 Tax=Devosia sp. TaxID=1871048 RepID=UPI0026164D55|nr:HlyD family secretion protein [Devosia sp.]MDB5539738.1 HlyD family secretion protein [Devosia sp.]
MTDQVDTPPRSGGRIIQLPRAEGPPPTGPDTAVRATAAAPDEPAPAPRKRRGGWRLALIISVPLLLVIAGGYFWLTSGRYQVTDNAYVNQSIVSLSSNVPGQIVEVDIKANQPVRAGDTLFRIDPQPYRIALDQANAALALARLKVAQLRVNYATAQSKLQFDQGQLLVQERIQSRNADLTRTGNATQAMLDADLLTYKQAQSAVTFDRQAAAGALAALGGEPGILTDDYPGVRSAAAQVASAQRNLDKTTITAPADGIIGQDDSLNVGQFVNTGATAASLVETSDIWIDANYKETQLGSIAVGQPAAATIDAYPGVTLFGTVLSINPATGSEFSLIPAQNATGNWVKVTQWVPVRIHITSNPGVDLRSGMSATVSVDTGKTNLDQLLHH